MEWSTLTPFYTKPYGGFKKNELKLRKKMQWVIPPEHNGEFVAQLEQILDVYKRPYDPLCPLVCMDESPRQLIRATRLPLAAEPGSVEREDYGYECLYGG